MDALHLTTAHEATDTRIFEKECKSLSTAGFDVGIIAHDAPSEPRDGVSFSSLGSADSRADRLWSIRSLVQVAACADTRLYHFHDLELLPVGVYLSRTTDAAVVYDVHENFGHVASVREWIPDWVAPFLSAGVPVAERVAASQIDAVVGVSDWIAEPFHDVADTVEVVHNFPKIDFESFTGETVQSKADCTLCFVGGLVDVRGIHRMLDLLRELVNDGIDAELWALGSWMPDADREAAERFIKTHGLGGRVTFPGYLDYSRMFQYLHAADIGLALLDVDYYTGAISTKLFEYLYAGLPVVTTPVDTAKEYLPAEYKYVVPQGDTPAAAEAVQRAIAADYDRTKMRRIVEERYSWESEAETLVGLYEDILM